MIDGRDGDLCVLSQKIHGRYFRFGLGSGHEPTGNPRDEFKPIDEGNQISLDRYQQCVYRRKRSLDTPYGMCLQQ